MSVLELTPAALATLAPAVQALTEAEGLLAHWRAVEVRVAKPAAARAPRRPAARVARPARAAGAGRRP
jgi:histidinol dehydrogenase